MNHREDQEIIYLLFIIIIIIIPDHHTFNSISSAAVRGDPVVIDSCQRDDLIPPAT